MSALEVGKISSAELLSRIQLLEDRVTAATTTTAATGSNGSSADASSSSSSDNSSSTGLPAPFALADVLKRLVALEQQTGQLMASAAQAVYKTDQVGIFGVKRGVGAAEAWLVCILSLASCCCAGCFYSPASRAVASAAVTVMTLPESGTHSVFSKVAGRSVGADCPVHSTETHCTASAAAGTSWLSSSQRTGCGTWGA